MAAQTMTPDERAAALAELNDAENRLTVHLEALKDADPFYFYRPSAGDLGPEAQAFLTKYLDPVDIPQHTDSQLDAHLCTAETIANFGGNRAGKTVWLVIEALIHATGELPNSLKDIYPREKLPVLKYRTLRIEGESDSQVDEILIPAFKYWVPRDFLAGRSWDLSYSAKSKILTLGKYGEKTARIKFNSFTQEVEKLQGAALTFVGYDEEPPQAHRKENLLRFGTAKRIEERFSMTPTRGLSWVKEEILDKQDAHTRAFKMASVTNPFVDLKVLDQIMSKLTTYPERKMRLLGEFVSLSGLIYGGLFNRALHVIPAFPVGCTCRTESPDKPTEYQRGETSTWNGEHHQKCPYRLYMIVRGMDIHTVTPPAVVEVAIDSQLNLYVCGVYNPESCPDIEILKKELAARVADRAMRVRWTIVDRSLDYEIKAAAGLNLYKKLVRGDYKVRPCYKSEKFSGSIMVGVDELKQLLKVNPTTGRPRLFFFDTPELAPLISDIETLERDTYRDEDKAGPKDKILEGKKHRHAALRYITQRKLVWHAPEEPQYIPADFGEDEAYI